MSAAAEVPVRAPGQSVRAARPVVATGTTRRTASSPYSRERLPLGDPSPLACTIAKAALEAVHGADTLQALVRWVEPDLRARLARQHSVARRSGRSGATARVLRARVCRVAAEAAEVSVVASLDGRSHAIAMRLEDQRGRWVATVIDIG